MIRQRRAAESIIDTLTAVQRAWERSNEPLFNGDQPATYQAIIEECEILVALTNQRPVGERAESDALRRLYGAMGRLAAPGELPPYPHRFSYEARRGTLPEPLDFWPRAHVGDCVNLEALRQDARVIKDWCLADARRETTGDRSRRWHSCPQHNSVQWPRGDA